MRKFTTLTFALLCLHFISNAQITKGSILIGGNISADFENNRFGSFSSNKKTILVMPSIGLAVKENTFYGISLSYSNTNANGAENINTYGGGVFIRKYRPLGKGFYLIGQGGLSTNYSKYYQLSSSGSIETFRQLYSYFSIFPGVSYAVSNKLHLETTLNNLLTLYYSHRSVESAGSSTAKTDLFGLGVNFRNASDITVGVRFIIAKKAK